MGFNAYRIWGIAEAVPIRSRRGRHKLKKKQIEKLLVLGAMCSLLGGQIPVYTYAEETSAITEISSEAENEQETEEVDQSNISICNITNYPVSSEGIMYSVVFNVETGELAVVKTGTGVNELRLHKFSTYITSPEIREARNKLMSMRETAINQAITEYNTMYMYAYGPYVSSLSLMSKEGAAEYTGIEEKYLEELELNPEYMEALNAVSIYTEYDIYITLADYFARGLYTGFENTLTTDICQSLYKFCDTGDMSGMQMVTNTLIEMVSAESIVEAEESETEETEQESEHEIEEVKVFNIKYELGDSGVSYNIMYIKDLGALQIQKRLGETGEETNGETGESANIVKSNSTFITDAETRKSINNIFKSNLLADERFNGEVGNKQRTQFCELLLNYTEIPSSTSGITSVNQMSIVDYNIGIGLIDLNDRDIALESMKTMDCDYNNDGRVSVQEWTMKYLGEIEDYINETEKNNEVAENTEEADNTGSID